MDSIHDITEARREQAATTVKHAEAYSGASPIKVNKLGHFVYEVTDIERTVKFWTEVMGFGDRFRPLGITAKDRLPEAMKKVTDLTFGSTDASLPMIWAMRRRLAVDTFVVLTDNETWAGEIQPVQALESYRQASGINAKLIVVGMTSTGFTIADPEDAGMLDVVGFDGATPALMAKFARGLI